MSPPRFHHALDDDGQPLDQPPVEGAAARSKLITPVPKAKRQRGKASPAAQTGFYSWRTKTGSRTSEHEYDPTPIINESAIC